MQRFCFPGHECSRFGWESHFRQRCRVPLSPRRDAVASRALLVRASVRSFDWSCLYFAIKGSCLHIRVQPESCFHIIPVGSRYKWPSSIPWCRIHGDGTCCDKSHALGSYAKFVLLDERLCHCSPLELAPLVIIAFLHGRSTHDIWGSASVV